MGIQETMGVVILMIETLAELGLKDKQDLSNLEKLKAAIGEQTYNKLISTEDLHL